MLRSVTAVVTGIFVLTATSFGIEAATAAVIRGTASGSAASSTSAFFDATMTAYTLLCVAGGGYVAAGIARRAPRGHAAVMGAVELLFTVGAMVQLGQAGRAAAWLPGILLMIPAAVAGGMIRARQMGCADAATEIR